jgi:hypothetical protein
MLRYFLIVLTFLVASVGVIFKAVKESGGKPIHYRHRMFRWLPQVTGPGISLLSLLLGISVLSALVERSETLKKEEEERRSREREEGAMAEARATRAELKRVRNALPDHFTLDATLKVSGSVPLVRAVTQRTVAKLEKGQLVFDQKNPDEDTLARNLSEVSLTVILYKPGMGPKCDSPVFRQFAATRPDSERMFPTGEDIGITTTLDVFRPPGAKGQPIDPLKTIITASADGDIESHVMDARMDYFANSDDITSLLDFSGREVTLKLYAPAGDFERYPVTPVFVTLKTPTGRGLTIQRFSPCGTSRHVSIWGSRVPKNAPWN